MVTVLLHQGARACVSSGRTDCEFFHPELALSMLEIAVIGVAVMLVVLWIRSPRGDGE